MTLGEKIKAFRNKTGLSQEQLAEKLHVSRQAITKWENDRGTPDINNLQLLASLMNVSVDSLINSPDEVTKVVIKEEINIERFEKGGKFRSKYDAALRSKFPEATTIFPLIRRKKIEFYTKGY